MAKQGRSTDSQLDGLTVAARDAAKSAAGKQLPPVHLWNPPFCGELDMRIAGDGTWFYMGTPIGRAALVRLFSTILKREDGKYFLVTPVEKVSIRVDDAPFLAVEMIKENSATGPLLRFRTNVMIGSIAILRMACGSKPLARAGSRPIFMSGPISGPRSRARSTTIWLTWARSA